MFYLGRQQIAVSSHLVDVSRSVCASEELMKGRHHVSFLLPHRYCVGPDKASHNSPGRRPEMT